MSIVEPQAPREVAFYVPEANANTDPDGYMTNNVEIDDRLDVPVITVVQRGEQNSQRSPVRWVNIRNS